MKSSDTSMNIWQWTCIETTGFQSSNLSSLKGSICWDNIILSTFTLKRFFETESQTKRRYSSKPSWNLIPKQKDPLFFWLLVVGRWLVVVVVVAANCLFVFLEGGANKHWIFTSKVEGDMAMKASKKRNGSTKILVKFASVLPKCRWQFQKRSLSHVTFFQLIIFCQRPVLQRFINKWNLQPSPVILRPMSFSFFQPTWNTPKEKVSLSCPDPYCHLDSAADSPMVMKDDWILFGYIWLAPFSFLRMDGHQDSIWYQHNFHERRKLSNINAYSPGFLMQTYLSEPWALSFSFIEICYAKDAHKAIMILHIHLGRFPPPPSNPSKKGFLGHKKCSKRWSLRIPIQLGHSSPGLRPYLPKRSKLSTQIRTSGEGWGISRLFGLVCWCFCVVFLGVWKKSCKCPPKEKSSNNFLGYKHQNVGK